MNKMMVLEYMKSAYYEAANCSTDPSTQNGAVLVAADVVVPVLDFPENVYLGVVPVRHGVASANFFPEGVKETQERWLRPAKYLYVEHAERNVIYKAARQGFCTEGATMIVPWAACADCARAIIQAGIREVITHHDPYADTRFGQPVSDVWKESIRVALGMLDEAGVKVDWIDDKIFKNDELKIRFNGQLVSP